MTLLSGRVPAGPDQIVFGARTLHSLDRHIGDTVSVVVPGATHRVRIVGEAVFPSFSMGSFTPTDLGSGSSRGHVPPGFTGCRHLLGIASLLQLCSDPFRAGSEPAGRLGAGRAGHRGRRLPCRLLQTWLRISVPPTSRTTPGCVSHRSC